MVTKEKQIKARYRIPRVDPPVDQSWWIEQRSPLESINYAFSAWIDLIPKDLAKVWSSVISTDVTKQERFNVTSLMISEMQKLRSEYKKKHLSDNKNEDKTGDTSDQYVSKCMNSIVHVQFCYCMCRLLLNKQVIKIC